MHSKLNKALEYARQVELSFCTWRLPGEAEIHSSGPAPEKVWDGKFHAEESFLFAPFDLERHPVFMLGKEGNASKINYPQDPGHTKKEHFLQWTSAAINAIKGGQFQKIVAARVQEKKPDKFDPVAHFLALCEEYPEAFCYLWHSPSTGTWMGASPELLLERAGENIRSMALAGTRAENEVPFGAKEKEEQGFVLRYLEEVLDPWLKEKVIADQIRTRSGHLYHLKNEVKGILKTDQPDMGKLIRELHPTPAVAGLPKAGAIAFIEQHEGFDRSYYSGFLGPVSSDHSKLFVNLRCMQTLHDTQYVYAGAGLTADSDPQKEWQETEEKTKVVLLLF
jgi:isochorismate synthase